MSKTVQLSSVHEGATFEVWGQKFTVLDRHNNGVFCLAAELTGDEVQFRSEEDEYKVAENDFRDSTIRRYLNETYLERLTEAGAKAGDIAQTEVDLKCTMGQHEYGTDRVLVGLLTLEQYGRYYDIIPLIEDCWWLATPWKTPSRSPSTNGTTYAWYVYTGGSSSLTYCSNSYGVRPALTLNPLLLVSVDGEPEKDGLASCKTEALLAELMRRAQEGELKKERTSVNA